MQTIKKIKWYSIDLLKSNPDCVFIFGDNLLHYGKGGQAIIRDEPNAYGIPTKKTPSMHDNAFFVDSEYEENCAHILKAIENIPKEYKTVVFPEDGLGTGLAQLHITAPKTFKFLNDTINSKFGDIYGF